MKSPLSEAARADSNLPRGWATGLENAKKPKSYLPTAIPYTSGNRCCMKWLRAVWIHTARSHFMQQRFPDVYGIAVGKYDFGFFAFSKPVAQPRGKFESARAASDNEDLMHHAPASSIFHEFHAFAPSLASGR